MMIWHFCPSPVDPEREQGGVSNVVRALALETSAAGVQTCVVCGDHELGRKMQETGTVFPNKSLTITTLRQWSNPALGPVGELDRIIASIGGGDVAHVHTCFSAFTDHAMRALARRGIPFVFSSHGKLSAAALSNRALPKRLWWKLISKPRIAFAHRVGASSRGEVADARSAGLAVPAVVIPNGYAPFTRSLPEKPLVPGKYILFLGYLDPRKRPELLIEAFVQSRFREDVSLVFVGPDTFGRGAALRNAAEAAGIAESVLFYGPAFGSDKWNLLANAQCLCLPSRAEGMPLVVLEAIGAETPVLVSPACNATEFVNAGAGIEVGEASASAWSAAIDTVLARESVRLKMKRAAAKIRSRYAWSTIAARWVEVYCAMASQPRQVGYMSEHPSAIGGEGRASL